MGKFGSSVKTLLSASGLKHAQIAQEISFDASYISKWINSSILPSPKAIDTIIEKLSACISDELSERGIDILSHELDQEVPEDASELHNFLSNLLYAAYEHDLKERDFTRAEMLSQDNSSKNLSVSNSVSQSIKENKENILQALSLYRERSENIEITVLGDIFHFPLKDILFLMDIHYEIERLNFKTSNYTIHVPQANIVKLQDSASNIALLNWMHLQSKGSISFCENDFGGTGFILLIKDFVLYEAQILHHNRWAYISCTWNKQLISELEYSLTHRIIPSGKPLFTRRTNPSEAYTSQSDPYFSGMSDKVLSGLVDMFLLSENSLKKALSYYPNITEDQLSYCLKRHRYFWHQANEGKQIQYVFYRQAFERLCYKGVMRILDKEVILPVDLRHQVICDMYTSSKLDNINIKMVDKFLVNAIKHKDLPNLYLSSTKSYFISFPVEDTMIFNTVADSSFHRYLHELFNAIWFDRLVMLTDAQEMLLYFKEISYEQKMYEFFSLPPQA